MPTNQKMSEMDKFLEILNPSKLSQEKSESLSRPTTASEIEAVIKKLPAYKVKNNIGNVEAKELICITHGHELQEGNMGGGVDRMEWNEGGGMGQL